MRNALIVILLPFAANKELRLFFLWFLKWSHHTRYGHSRISEGSGLNGTCPTLTVATRMLFFQRICSIIGANKGARGDQKLEIGMRECCNREFSNTSKALIQSKYIIWVIINFQGKRSGMPSILLDVQPS